MSLSNEVIAVTGAGSGIGRATAVLLSKRGAKLSLIDVDQAGLDKTVDLLKDTSSQDVLTMIVNVAEGEEVQAWIKETVARFGRLDGAANVAGIFRPCPLASATPSDWTLTMDVNAKGIFHCLQAQIEALGETGGSIVCVASSAGVKGLPSAPIYAASKHAVVGLCASVAGDVARRNIRVNTVAPGLIDTPMTTSLTEGTGGVGSEGWNPMGRAARAEEVANIIIYLLGDESSFVTGACWRVDGGHTI